ncbi:ferric reductase-like transmembrane domain-containing protein [Spirosoma sp. SC4-14]|uniref:ferredoxin reductase family protein n=1 Tax=Spirosoma sp. SC4-14 TaxID=3128900 RepID=UPI0030D2D5BB
MKPTQGITGALVVAIIIFALSPGPQHIIQNPTIWEFREQFVYLTGVSAMSLMVLSMVISVRIPWVNQRMRGLDKAYVVHKWAGIVATLLLMLHWLDELGPQWLVEWGFIPNPGDLSDGSGFSELEIKLFQSGVALAQLAFYGSLILVGIALCRKIPYRVFRKSHKIFPVLFLLAAYHGATAQLKEHWLSSPAGYLLLALLTTGLIAALTGLFQRIGTARKRIATIIQIDQHEHGILDLWLTTAPNPFFYEPGQYAFLRFLHDTEPHPFTIASWDNDPHKLRFSIKSLGDFTESLTNQLQIGQPVTIEGPYGEFRFDAPGTQQIWIAGGIGITPFMARLDYLASQGGSQQPIHFWYSTRSDKSTLFPESLEALCQQNGIHFYHLNSTQKEYLTAEILRQTVGNLNQTSIWFCGPPTFAQCLLNGLADYGFDKRQFHYDSFTMR